MKISYRTHPILTRLEECFAMGGEFFNSFRDKEKIVLAHEFVGKAIEYYKKLHRSDVYRHLKSQEVILIVKKLAYFFSVWNNGKTLDCQMLCITETKEVYECHLVIEYGDYDDEFIYEDDNIHHKRVFACITMLLFKQFAPIETKYLSGRSKVNDINCKYINESNTDFTFMDCTWFTNLVKSDAFNVRGHLRLQPCGEGLKDRKMIWIKDFQKHGYTRQAGKLKEEAAS